MVHVLVLSYVVVDLPCDLFYWRRAIGLRVNEEPDITFVLFLDGYSVFLRPTFYFSNVESQISFFMVEPSWGQRLGEQPFMSLYFVVAPICTNLHLGHLYLGGRAARAKLHMEQNRKAESRILCLLLIFFMNFGIFIGVLSLYFIDQEI